MIGKRLSHFRILEKVGEGGMGVVYRAEDETLRRVVALKVLPPDLVGNEKRRLRLLREARAAAAVSHPNLATIYEIAEADGVVFIAMEYIEGPTLRRRIGGRPMEMKEALRIAAEVAEGLAQAHRANVIHRDLKPDNVIVASQGQVKILDFGLAKLLHEEDENESDASRMTTISGQMTRAGGIVGTASYMSPEQARGQDLDARTDLFSFGVVLYEMATGALPFQGKSPGALYDAILHGVPVSPTRLNPHLPADLAAIIGKAESDVNI